MAAFTVRAGMNAALRLSPETQTLLVGKARHLRALSFDGELAAKLGDLVTPALWTSAIAAIHKSGSTTLPLHLNLAKVIALSDDASRHNAPSNSFAIFKEVKGTQCPEGVKNVSVVLLADACDVVASVAAISRCFPLYDARTKVSSPLENVHVEVVVPAGGVEERDVDFLQTLCDSIRAAARLVDMPCSVLHSEAFADEAASLVGKLDGVESTVVKGDELLQKGFGGIYHVGKAAAHPPVFACFSYKPKGATHSFALVGKGIVFDAGGMQIKPKASMPGMKQDMGGAAGLLSAFNVLVRSGFEQNLHLLLCIAENSISPLATRPDDIITMLSGKSVEVNNTDAEGRLVLADGVFYAKSVLQAETIIDMATLTGAQSYATGRVHAAVLTNSEEWERRACAAGRASGDLVHPLPYCPDLYFSDLKSPVADMRNSNLGKMQGPPSSIAGLFIAAQLDFSSDVSWLHFDIAAPVDHADRATGYGPALICVLLKEHLNVPILKKMDA